VRHATPPDAGLVVSRRRGTFSPSTDALRFPGTWERAARAWERWRDNDRRRATHTASDDGGPYASMALEPDRGHDRGPRGPRDGAGARLFGLDHTDESLRPPIRCRSTALGMEASGIRATAGLIRARGAQRLGMAPGDGHDLGSANDRRGAYADAWGPAALSGMRQKIEVSGPPRKTATGKSPAGPARADFISSDPEDGPGPHSPISTSRLHVPRIHRQCASGPQH